MYQLAKALWFCMVFYVGKSKKIESKIYTHSCHPWIPSLWFSWRTVDMLGKIMSIFKLLFIDQFSVLSMDLHSSIMCHLSALMSNKANEWACMFYVISKFHAFLFVIRVVAYLSRVLEAAFTALEGLNKQAFLTELVQKFYFLHHISFIWFYGFYYLYLSSLGTHHASKC